jgi:C-terminal processing protease CtpA/Prc
LFKLNDLFEIGIPTNDFVSVHGFRVDKKGIEPDIKTGSKDALNHTLELIKQKEIFKNDQE